MESSRNYVGNDIQLHLSPRFRPMTNHCNHYLHHCRHLNSSTPNTGSPPKGLVLLEPLTLLRLVDTWGYRAPILTWVQIRCDNFVATWPKTIHLESCVHVNVVSHQLLKLNIIWLLQPTSSCFVYRVKNDKCSLLAVAKGNAPFPPFSGLVLKTSAASLYLPNHHDSIGESLPTSYIQVKLVRRS